MPPLFYHPSLSGVREVIVPKPDVARHITQVLRMQAGEAVQFTDGRGIRAHGLIAEAGKKSCTVTVHQTEFFPDERRLHLAVGFTKNTSRNEWLLEKAAELGVKRIIPLQSERSNRDRIKQERWHTILVSAMLQSQQFYLPVLEVPATPEAVLGMPPGQAFIAHCLDQPFRIPWKDAFQPGKESLILIGPEGDFSPEEISLATARGAVSVSLGNTRLRTETAAIAACAVFHLSRSS